ncbi:hypothetical protein [Streptomyces sp. NPDC005408]|uniref:hypothetical protein n=1 Tax=Streptomyces sp. NPDC005408 TaxID=3155341 RepID=UPI0033A91EEB
MIPHKWWHSQSLREARAVGDGWQAFLAVYNATARDSVALKEIRADRLAQSLERAAQTEFYAPLLQGKDLSAQAAGRTLMSLPTLSKSVVRSASKSFLTGLVHEEDELRVQTSGTSGEPMTIVHDDSLLTEAAAASLRMMEAYGLAPGYRLLRFTSDPRHKLVNFDASPYNGASVVVTVNVSKIDRESCEYVNRICEDFRPHAVWGQPMEVLLAILRQREGLLRLPKPMRVLTHGDTLDPKARKAIAASFDAPHSDLYGLQEFGRVAWECPESPETYHIEEERVRADVAQDGHLLITGLVNKATAFLRYQPGDCAEILHGTCSCGRPHARLTKLEGRQRGLVVDAHGQFVSVKPLRIVLESMPLDRWQVRQIEPGQLHIRVAPNDMSTGEQIAGELSKILGKVVAMKQLTVETVKLSELAAGGEKAPHFRLLVTQESMSESAPSGTGLW